MEYGDMRIGGGSGIEIGQIEMGIMREEQSLKKETSKERVEISSENTFVPTIFRQYTAERASRYLL